MRELQKNIWKSIGILNSFSDESQFAVVRDVLHDASDYIESTDLRINSLQAELNEAREEYRTLERKLTQAQNAAEMFNFSTE